jgi:hypothetical protein
VALLLLIFKPVFHFKRIKNVFKFQNFVNVDWLVSSVVRQKVDLRRTFYFDTPGSTWFYKPLFNLRMLTSTFRYDTGEVENRLFSLLETFSRT